MDSSANSVFPLAQTFIDPVTGALLGGVTRAGVVQGSAFQGTGLPGALAGGRNAGATTAGPPVTGTFATGDTVTDITGTVWVCTSGGTPGTWTSPSADPWGIGCDINYSPGVQGSIATQAMVTGGTAIFSRFVTYGYAMPAVFLNVGVQSGSIAAGVYSPGSNGLPGALQATTTAGGVACPSPGTQSVALSSSVTPLRGWWIAVAADNTTATFKQVPGVAGPGQSAWLQSQAITSLTFPATASTSAAPGNRTPMLGSAA